MAQATAVKKGRPRPAKGKSKATAARKPAAAAPAYSDGHPLDEIQYLECKIILKPDRFTSADSLRAFGKLVARAAGGVKKVTFTETPTSAARHRSGRSCSLIRRTSASTTTRTSCAGA